MRRLALLLCLVALPAFGLTKPVVTGARIGVLRTPEPYAWDKLAKSIASDLRDELQHRGFNSFDAGMTLEELQRHDEVKADYFVEVTYSEYAGREHGAVGAAIGAAVIDVAVETSEVGAEVRLYDGRTLEVVDVYHPHARQTTAVPAGIGIGTRAIWASFALPFIREQQLRTRAHDVARDAADRIARR